jgi:ABC-type multidrug transport system ATPase subunit
MTVSKYLIDKAVTSITVAHRLQTVINCDLVLVLDKGEILEYDAPSKLLEKSDESSFRSLVLETGHQSSQRLIGMATKKSMMNIQSRLDEPLTEEEDEEEAAIATDFELYQAEL